MNRYRLRQVLIAVASILGVIWIPIPFTAVQIYYNREELANMQDRVQAVQEFQVRHLRLPDQQELNRLSEGLPDRLGFHRNYCIRESPPLSGSGVVGFPSGWPVAGGWALEFSRGESRDYYSSWDNHYTLTGQLSWRVFWGPLWWPLQCAGIGSILLFAIARKLR
ncbi:MAG: hypothetical protein NTY53_13740, partial [Kiritimatiellaeota bacterium]|nr:hypothetical protein [Kiritimatiellota bacterium]